jgi:dTDP-4-amino-4,6-dideoxygalactose transaminase
LSKCSLSLAEENAVQSVLKSEFLGMGRQVLAFEQAIQTYLKTSMKVICVNTGTSALQLALSALDIGIGDEVLVPSLTYVASFQAISATGAKPIACEVLGDTLFIDVKDAEKKITERTKAIMPVHYASASLGMGAIYQLAKKHKLRVVEDAAQAFGCEREGLKIGTIGDIICFSFDGIKNITSGEGGAILTNDKNIWHRLEDGRLLGVQKDSEKRYAAQRSWEFDVECQGFRFHMSDINAAIGIEQLNKIDIFKQKRQDISKLYLQEFSKIKAVNPIRLNYDEIIPHIFVIKSIDRDLLRNHLLSKDIECGVHYKPNHLLKKYQAHCNLPVTEKIYQEILTLPCHVDLTIEEQSFVIQEIKNFYG